MIINGKRAARNLSVAAAAAILLGASGCAAGGGGADDGATTIRWWTWNPDDNTARAYIEDYEAENPDVNIEHRFIQYSDYANTV